MKQNGSKCERAFNDGQRARQSHPLPSGRYKLQNVRSRMVKALQEWDVIKVAKTAVQPGRRRLSPPVPEYAAGWIKRMPENIARDLGFDVIPAVGALAGDEMSLSEVNKLVRRARSRASDLVSQCDQLRERLRVWGVEFEYYDMKHGGSMLEQLIIDVIWLIDEMLWATDQSLRVA